MPTTHYRRNEQLPTVRAGYPGNQLIGKEFVNVGGLYDPQWSTALRWMLTANPQKEEKKKDTWVPAVVPCAEAFASRQDMLVWLGHACFLLRVRGVSMLFDPVLYSSVGLRHRHPLPCRPEDVRSLDYLLLSHAHRDHTDERTIRQLARQNPQLQVLGPLGMAGLLHGWVPGLPVQEAGWWQRFDLGPAAPFELYYLPASHWSRRWLTDDNRILWGSFLLRTDDRTIYFGGDSSWAGHFEEIEQTFGPLDIVLLPIGAYKPPFMMQRSHLNPHEAAKTANVLRAGHLVPMHYGTFDLSDEPASEPLRLIRAAATGGMLRGELHTPAVGEVLDWTRWE